MLRRKRSLDDAGNHEQRYAHDETDPNCDPTLLGRHSLPSADATAISQHESSKELETAPEQGEGLGVFVGRVGLEPTTTRL